MIGAVDNGILPRYTIPRKEVTAVKREKNRWVLPVLIGAVTLFIWSQSLLPGKVSAQESGFFTTLLAGLLGMDTVPVWMHALVRKLAHFTEFGVLGGLWSGQNARRPARLSWLYGLAVASADECLQMLSPDRGPAVTDVLIDYAGYLCGWLAVFGLIKIIRRKEK